MYRMKRWNDCRYVAAVFICTVVLMLVMTMHVTAREYGIPVTTQFWAIITTSDNSTSEEIREALGVGP